MTGQEWQGRGGELYLGWYSRLIYILYPVYFLRSSFWRIGNHHTLICEPSLSLLIWCDICFNPPRELWNMMPKTTSSSQR
jgi:hypothetical protein